MKNQEDNVKCLKEEIHQNADSPRDNDVLDAQKITFQDIKEHMTGPVVSVITHIILLSILGSMIIFKAPPERKEFDVAIKNLEIVAIKEIPEPPTPKEIEPTETDFKTDSPEMPTDDPKVDDVPVPNSNEIEVPSVPVIKYSASSLVFQGALPYNRTPGGIKEGLKNAGAPAGTERVLVKGLRWLRDHQNDDGSWGEDPSRKPAFTGLAILAFLGHGETPSSVEFGACILKGIKKLVEYSDSLNPVQTSSGNGYGHPIVTYALSEAYGMTKICRLETAVNKMIDITVKGQNTIGGFNYSYNNGEGRCDLSVMGWANQAMKAAFAAGSTVPNLEAAMEKALQCVKTQQRDSRSGGFVYSTNIGTPEGGATNNVTAVGTLCLQLFGEGKSSEAAGGLKYLKERCFASTWDKEELEKNGGITWALYRWYYQTQAFFQENGGKGQQWMAWNKLFTKALMKNQKADGHWESPASEVIPEKGKMEGHGEMMFKGVEQGIYSTSLCCLMLEVYYRHLPTFKVVESRMSVANNQKKDQDEGLVIE